MKMGRVSDVADQVRGVTYGKADVSDQPRKGFVPVLRAMNITDNGLNFDDLVYIREERVRERQRLRKGDILIAASSGSLSVVGKAAQAKKDYAAGFGAFCKVVRPRQNINAEYLGFYFQTFEYRSMISSLAAGININNLRSEHIADLPIPLPNPEEQERIATVLCELERLRHLHQQAVESVTNLMLSQGSLAFWQKAIQ